MSNRWRNRFWKLNTWNISLIDLAFWCLCFVFVKNVSSSYTIRKLDISTMNILNALSISLLGENLSLSMLIFLLKDHRARGVAWTKESLYVCCGIIRLWKVKWLTKWVLIKLFEPFQIIQCRILVPTLICVRTCRFANHLHMFRYIIICTFTTLNTHLRWLVSFAIELRSSVGISASAEMITPSWHQRLVVISAQSLN